MKSNKFIILYLSGLMLLLVTVNALAKEKEKWAAEGLKATKIRCELVAQNLKDQWLYYDNFRIYKMGFSIGAPVDSYTCTISATHMNITNNVRTVRIKISQRTDSERFTYQFIPTYDGFPNCHEESITDCK